MTQDPSPLSTIAMFGKRDEIWPVAALLAKNLPGRIRLTIIEDPGEPAPPGALTLACDNPFHECIGVTVRDLVRHCNGTLGLGTDHRDWHGEGGRFFAAPSGTVPAINGIALHHIMLRAASMYEEPEKLAHLLEPFRFAARAALAGKFSFPTDDRGSPLTMLGPTVQCDRTAYAAFLKDRFPASAAQIFEASPVGADIDSDEGYIRSVGLADGRAITADFFVDVSGALSGVLPEECTPDAQRLTDILAFDRVLSGRGGEARPDHSHTVAKALPGGLSIATPLGDGAVSELLFTSGAMDEAVAQRLVASSAESRPFEPRITDAPWTGNLARLGSAAVRFGPHQSADMRLLHEQALHLVRCLPATRRMDIEATEFNRKQARSAEQIRDFLLLPLVLNGRNDAPWAGMREAALPETLAIRLEQFRSRGRFVTFDNEQFDRQTWIDMMIGFGVVPERYDPAAQSIDMRHVQPVLKRMVDAFTQAIDYMPDLARYRQDFAEGTL
ncbi:tryptophan 7-halogenase [Parasphingopyxis algicola]|uniref:tryptophan 7-halogenase n=1 Tax=Parasphingopyxis algicola TaxID=2026624 RepID=UPI0015A0DAD0|nr:tryptophan 7-halogenase [Parasphingopyxis algicola]QLC23800.1 tryptophan 7-halogenase [Parasphingopyxis algicola]